MKATSIFGGVQIYNIIISLIRSKFIAILLGPAGMGISGLLISAISFVEGLTNFGLGTSAIKNLASSNSAGDTQRISTTIIVIRRWVWITGMLGMIVALILSPLLSSLTFGNHDYTIAFVWISISLLFKQLSSGEMVLLQGLQKINLLAKANLVGSTLGLLITVPLYYKLGIEGIVPTIIITTLITLISSKYYASKIKFDKVPVTRVNTLSEGKEMLTMGFMISLSGLISIGSSYLIKIFISNTGSIEQVGLYNAGFTIINSYAGLVLAAMGTDYFPRLSKVAQNNSLCNETINQQAEIAILILAPIIMVFLVFIKYFIILLYSYKFIAINELVHWAALGMLFRALSWSISYIFLAKGSTKLFFWSEMFVNSYMLLLNIAGYYFMGLTGLGVSFLVGYLLYFIQVFWLSHLKYKFSFNNEIKVIFIVQFLIAFTCLLIVKLLPTPYSYLVGSILICCSFYYSYKNLEEKLKFKKLLITHLNKNK